MEWSVGIVIRIVKIAAVAVVVAVIAVAAATERLMAFGW